MPRLILDDGTTYEVKGFGTPLKGESYIRWDEETCDGPLVNEAAENHASDSAPRVLLEKVECDHEQHGERTETHSICKGCGACLG